METAEKIRAINDTARHTFEGCRVVLTAGVQQLGCLPKVLNAVRSFSSFDENNDPHWEHDFGSLRMNDQTVFWKFDYCDVDLQMASPDPADPTVTVRVMTIMLAEEY